MEEIKTAVDSLIELVQREKKPITIDEVAKQLNLPVVIVHEWASFLEEAKVIEIDYKLNTPYIKIKKDKNFSSTKKTKDEIQKEREILIIKSQANLKDLKAKREYLNWLKTKFVELEVTKKRTLAKPLAIVLDQKGLIEEAIFKLLVDLKEYNTKKQKQREFDRLRERFKKIEDRTKVFEQNLQKISGYMGSAH